MHSLTVKTKMRMFGLNQKGAGGRKKGTKHIRNKLGNPKQELLFIIHDNISPL